MKDWRDNEYDVGSKILYPRMASHSMEMCEGTVTKIDSEGQEVGYGANWHLAPVVWVKPER